MMNGLYIHIPFCHSKCYYCDFYSTPNIHIDRDSYVTALIDEYHRRKSLFEDEFDTVYIGGGTPSILSLNTLERLTKSIRTTDLKEFTIEVNPEDVSESLISGLKQMPVTRISMGVQSLVDEELRRVGRRHDADTARQAMELIAKSGLKYSFDLIYGLPNQTIDSMMLSLNGLLDYQPHHLSAYILSYEPGTRLTAMLQKHRIKQADDELIEKMYRELTHTLRLRGYDHYEISNFGLPGSHAVHNSKYWMFVPYLGLGASAHSFDGRMRWSNVADVREYMSGVPAIVENESLKDRVNDYIISSLRTSAGLSLVVLRELCCSDAIVAQVLKSARRWIENKTIEHKDSCLVIPEDSWLLSDAIMRDLMV